MKPVGSLDIAVSVPNNEPGEDGWSIGTRKGHPSINMAYLPIGIREWSNIEFSEPNQPVKFHVITDDNAVVTYLVVAFAA